ncbi:MAG: histidine kinase [Leptospiraceae bacterium]|nr:histidine kinase [Leptospiraceae bacterium]MCB1303760.1 histidine kinase [Leptospiraceae bacterium]
MEDLAVDVKDRERILDAVNAGKRVKFVTYSLTDTMERQLDFVVAAILKKYNHSKLQSTLYSCLKELVVNATKANAKRVYFEELGLDIANPDQYRQGMESLKSNLSESWIKKYGELARRAGLESSISFDHNPHGLRIIVLNDTDLLGADESRIREKLSEGMSYEDLLSFYMANGDQTEGEGMGLVMNLLLLKGEEIDPALFRIGNLDGKTMGRIEIPFSEKFQSVRGTDPRGWKERPPQGEIELDFTK